MSDKRCDRCGKTKDVTEFYKRSASPDGYNYICKACDKLQKDERQARTRSRQAVVNARAADVRKDMNLNRLYGIGLAEYENMLEQQGGCCAICGRSIEDFGRDLAVDHDHETGAVRGLLCPDCNRGLGGFQDDVELVGRAFKYLTKHNARL